MKFIRVALRAKGPRATLRRVSSLTRRYGLSPRKIGRSLLHFASILRRFECGATFPITAVALARHSSVITDERLAHIEFAVHGYTHIDYTQLSPTEQMAHLRMARQVFAAYGLPATGFRSPYLRHDAALSHTLAEVGFSYVSNQPFLWDVLTQGDLPPEAKAAHRHALDFYAPWTPQTQRSLPCLVNGLVEIPVSLPDDEMLVERLRADGERIAAIWLRELHASHRRGELLTLQLHPERAFVCSEGLQAVLAEARALRPAVWIARLDEIAAWWQERAVASITLHPQKDGTVHVHVAGPAGIITQVRGAQVSVPAQPRGEWLDVVPLDFDVQADRVHLVEVDDEVTDEPGIRLGLWPNGAQSALAITGDIDGLTLWDYAWRILGR